MTGSFRGEPKEAPTPVPFDTIVLLAGSLGAPELIRFLESQRADLTVLHVETGNNLRALAPATLARARLIGFGTDVLVPAAVLRALGYGAYNFHPGPPTYPGWAPYSFAIYDRANMFGATAHEMVKQVDAGPIIGTEMFFVPPGQTASQLSNEALRAMLRLMRRLGPTLARSATRPPPMPIHWGPRRATRAAYAQMCRTLQDQGADDLLHRIRAVGIDEACFPKPCQPNHGVSLHPSP